MADTIKEFLVGLGFKVNGSEERRFNEAIASATLRATLLADALEAAAKSVAKAVAAIAEGFESIYYASQRTNASIQNLRGLSYAVGQLGGSYQGALASVEGFAKAMRTNPGYGALVRSLGVATEANGKLRDTTEIMSDLGKVFAGQKYYVGFQYAQALGIDEATFRALRDQPEALRRYKEEYAATAKTVGLNSEEAGKNSAEFMQSLRSLGVFISTVAEKLLSDLAPALKGVIDQFLAWVRANPEIVHATIKAIGDAAKWVGERLQDLAVNGREYFDLFLDKVHEWTKEGSLLDILGKTAKAIERIVTAIGNAIQWLHDFDRATEMKGLKDIGEWLGWIDKKTAPALTEGRRQIGALDQATDTGIGVPSGGNGRGAAGWWRRTMPTWLGGDASPASGANAGTGITRRGSRAAEADKKNYNFTGENADVLRQAAKELGTSPEDLATVISYESKFSPSVHGGTGSRYHGLIQFGGPEREQYGANDRQSFKEQMPAVVRYLKDRGFKPGMGLLDLYSTINAGRPGRYDASDGHGTVRSHVAKMQRDEAARVQRFLNSGSKPSGAPSLDMGSMAKALGKYDFGATHGVNDVPPLGTTSNDNSSSLSLNQTNTTNVTVMGSADPTATGNAVGQAQNGVNRISLRNAQSAMR